MRPYPAKAVCDGARELIAQLEALHGVEFLRRAAKDRPEGVFGFVEELRVRISDLDQFDSVEHIRTFATEDGGAITVRYPASKPSGIAESPSKSHHGPGSCCPGCDDYSEPTGIVDLETGKELGTRGGWVDVSLPEEPTKPGDKWVDEYTFPDGAKVNVLREHGDCDDGDDSDDEPEFSRPGLDRLLREIEALPKCGGPEFVKLPSGRIVQVGAVAFVEPHVAPSPELIAEMKQANKALERVGLAPVPVRTDKSGGDLYMTGFQGRVNLDQADYDALCEALGV